MPSTGDVSDRGRGPGAAPLITAVRQLAERGVYGLVWAGPDLIVEATFGPLARFVGIGEPLTASIYAIVGLEDDIAALRNRPGHAIELPDVTLVTREGRRPRATLSMAWSEDDGAFVLLLARTESRSDFEAELTAQMRARLIAESELAAKTRELQRANADLESYASIISHDLQSPMRALRYALDDLGKTTEVSPEANAALGKIRDLSQRMTAMLSALLDYASVTRLSDAVERIDTAALVRAVVGSVDRPPGLAIEISGTWPVASTMAAPLDLVLRNLIDNAIKHHDRAIGVVTVSASPASGTLTITVTDDGPGIRPEHRDVVFLPFRKLGARPSSGQGMGLALVRRTVDNVGARITMDSSAPADRGTSFTLHWPIG